MTPLVLKLHLLGFDLGLSLFGLILGLAGGLGAAALASAGLLAPAAGRRAVRWAKNAVAGPALAAGGATPGAARLPPPLYAVQPLQAAALALWTLVLVLYARRPRGGRVLGAYLLG